jgi:NitT/TauT family transport system substrate-binding protein
MQIRQNRRDFIASASLVAAAAVLGARGSLADEGPPETTKIRLKQSAAICFAPAYVVEPFLRAEGFTDIQHVDAGLGLPSGEVLARGDLDFDITFAGTVVHHLDLERPVTAVGGLHVGCYELFAREPIRTIGDLKGHRVGIQTVNGSDYFYISIMAKYVGLDPKEDQPEGQQGPGPVHRRRE